MVTFTSCPDLKVNNGERWNSAFRSIIFADLPSDYTSYVLPLVKLSDAEAANNYVCGTLFIKRENGAGGNYTAVDITASKAHGAEECANHTIYRGGFSYEYARPCTFQYDGIKYFGIQGEVPSACPTFSAFYGVLSDESIVKYIPYKNNQTGEIISAEVNDSLAVQEYDSTVYRVGAIYISTVDISPASIFGGTWERFGNGRVLVGVDSSQTEFNTVEKTGGAKTASFKAESMIAHAAGVNATQSLNYEEVSGDAWTNNYRMPCNGYVTEDTNNHYAGFKVTGSTNTGSILQPYITCYMWKRTA